MRVAHFIQRYPPALGGSEAYFARLSRFLAERQVEVNVFTSQALKLEAFWSLSADTLPAGVFQEADVEVRRYRLWRWPGRRWLLKPLSLLPMRAWQCLTFPWNPLCPGMWGDAGRIQPPFDLVHASAFPYGFPLVCGLRLARRQKIPLVLTPFLHLGDADNPHDPVRRVYTSPPLVWLLRQADAIFVQTPSERRAVLERGIAPERIHLQGLGVDPAEVTAGDRNRYRSDWPTEAFVVGHLANQSYEKGTNDLLQAVERAWSAGGATRVLLAGPEMPNFKSFWEGFTRRHPERSISHVRRLGLLRDEDRRDFYAAVDLFALPSRSDSFGLVLLEAWANGLPNLAYRAGGPADLIRSEQDGLLVSTGDLAGLAEGLIRFEKNGLWREQLGAVGRQRVREFHWQDKLEQVETLYRELVQKKSRAD